MPGQGTSFTAQRFGTHAGILVASPMGVQDGGATVQRQPFLILAASALGILAPGLAAAQAPVYVRVTPEINILRVKHTKVLTELAGESTGTGTGTGGDFVAGIAIGHLGSTERGLIVGGELQALISSRQTVSGRMQPQGGGTGRVGPGRWEFENKVGVGVSGFVGRELRSRNLSSYLVAGLRRWSTEMASVQLSGFEAIGEFTDRPDDGVVPRRSLTVGIGITVTGERPIDIRLRYERSGVASYSKTHTLDPESQEVDPETVRWDYSFSASGIGLQIGFGTG